MPNIAQKCARIFQFQFLLISFHFLFERVFPLTCFNSCTPTAPSPFIFNVTRNSTKTCKESCDGNSCYTMYSPHFSVPNYGCSTRNLTYPGCISENGTMGAEGEVICYCLRLNCNMPVSELLKEGWSFPEIVLTLPLSTFLNSTMALTSTGSASLGNITIRDLHDGVNLGELISPLLNPEPSIDAQNSNSSATNLTFPLVMVKPPNPLFDEDEGKRGKRKRKR